jgi:hypothetical protein
MPLFYFPEDLRLIADGLTEVSTPGETIEEALTFLIKRYPELEAHIYDQSGQFIKLPSPAINLLVGNHDFRELDGLETLLQEDTRIRICRTWSSATSGRRY